MERRLKIYAAVRRQPAALQGKGQRGRAEPSRAEPILAGADRAGLTAPHRTGPLYLQLHLPAMTRTFKEEENVACECASLVPRRRRRGRRRKRRRRKSGFSLGMLGQLPPPPPPPSPLPPPPLPLTHSHTHHPASPPK
ncbi:DM7 family protein GE17491-like [Sphaeramia orbicularis]|uniref:DM7 family protein GE17491-like n=1 Tax=Sphaeramia orbicularis TaxID=375764 RepID=UPI00117EF832|nr:DM7 family protein GE17491-like [Sphaeramia orbicularis]